MRLASAPFAKVHQYRIHRHPVQPGRKRRVATKRGEFSEDVNEGILRQVLRFGDIFRHPQADCHDARFVRLIQHGKSIRVPIPGLSDEILF